MTREGYEKHKELFYQWLAGAEIVCKYDGTWLPSKTPSWDATKEYKLEPFAPEQGDKVLVKGANQWHVKTFVAMDCGRFKCISSGTRGWSIEGLNGEFLRNRTWDIAIPWSKEREEEYCDG